jgi:hypothetical protein
MKKRTIHKRSLIPRNVVLIVLFFSAIFLIPVFLKTNIVIGATKTEANEAIYQAFIKIEEASKEGINVTQQVIEINSAIQDYNDGLYTEAYDKAQVIIAELAELIDSYRTGRLFPYIMIPFNTLCVAVIVVYLIRNIRNRTKKEPDEKFKDLDNDHIVEKKGDEENDL